jgi:hypothetical protein
MEPKPKTNGRHAPKATKAAIAAILMFPLILSCKMSQEAIDKVLFLFQEGEKTVESENSNPSGADMVRMDARGSFDEAYQRENGGVVVSENELSISWLVDGRNGEAGDNTWGEGKLVDQEDGGRLCEHDLDLNFIGTVTPDGTNYTGTVHVTGQASCPDGWSDQVDYTTNWTATRQGDQILGEVVGIGPFRLDVIYTTE